MRHMLNVQQIADRLKLSTRVIYLAIQNGDLEHHRFGRQIRVSEEQLRHYIETSRVQRRATTSRLDSLIRKHLGS
jgi:excisionase family DNA binding protein